MEKETKAITPTASYSLDHRQQASVKPCAALRINERKNKELVVAMVHANMTEEEKGQFMSKLVPDAVPFKNDYARNFLQGLASAAANEPHGTVLRMSSDNISGGSTTGTCFLQLVAYTIGSEVIHYIRFAPDPHRAFGDRAKLVVIKSIGLSGRFDGTRTVRVDIL